MAHDHVVEAPHGPSHPGGVMADIGGDVGAAILYVPDTLAGLEIEIRPVGRQWDGTHTAVRERHVNDAVVWAAFFGSLRAGSYELRVRGDGARGMTLDVTGGQVSELSW